MSLVHALLWSLVINRNEVKETLAEALDKYRERE